MATLILDLPSGTKIQFNLSGQVEEHKQGFERIDIIPLAVLDFTTEEQYMLRYYNSGTGESYETKIAFPNPTSAVALDLNGKLEMKRRKVEVGYDFFHKLVALMQHEFMGVKQSKKLTLLFNDKDQKNVNLAISTVREQYSKLKIG
jgi:hypothetical protein